MSKQKQGSAARRAWRRAKSKAVCDALRGLCALEGLRDEFKHNDVGQWRNSIGWRLGAAVVSDCIDSAVGAYLRANPKPK
jgi:hypothetical protein